MRPMRRTPPSDPQVAAHAPTPLTLVERLRLSRTLGVSLYELERALHRLASGDRSRPDKVAEVDLRRVLGVLRDGSGVMPAVRLPSEGEVPVHQQGRIVDRQGRATHLQCSCADMGSADFRCRLCDGSGWVPR